MLVFTMCDIVVEPISSSSSDSSNDSWQPLVSKMDQRKSR